MTSLSLATSHAETAAPAGEAENWITFARVPMDAGLSVASSGLPAPRLTVTGLPVVVWLPSVRLTVDLLNEMVGCALVSDTVIL